MVEIQEHESGDENSAQPEPQQEPQPEPQQQQRTSRPNAGRGIYDVLVEFSKEDPVYTLCSWLRILTLLFALSFVMDMLGLTSFKSSYYKAFGAAAATNSFRLYQRLRSVNSRIISQAFLQQLFTEDSAHYLLYSISFVSSPPVTMALGPIVLYSFLHTISYLIKIGEVTGQSRAPFFQNILNLRDQYTQVILSTVSCVEIFIFPVFFAMILRGKASILFVFIYFRFLSLRYSSRRNPHTRIAFYNLKMSLFDVASKPACPNLVRQFIYKSVELVSRFAPPVQ
ncbi:Transmembrane protein 33-like protein [Aphelenchoides bicaudatus]|nr:Transmembrane protein 33-like protein [Aphelenchoides bicaudatus]